MNKQSIVLTKLHNMGIRHKVVLHPAVFTVEDMKSSGLDAHGEIPKNLFLRDAKGRRHFLVVASKDKTIDLKLLGKQLGAGALSFASEKRLAACLNLTRGSVTPFGVLNDSEHLVEVVMDRALVGLQRLGFHPNENTATVFLSFADLLCVLETCGNTIIYID